MGAFLEDKDRNIIPRLRSFETTLALGELKPVASAEEVDPKNQESIISKVAAWKRNGTTSFAADLVAAAFVLGRHADAKEAAEFLMTKSSNAPAAAREIAKRILVPVEKQRARAAALRLSLPNTAQIREGIHEKRRRTIEEPRNAILWADLAREYALVGENKKAIRAMNVAVDLGSSNRFILRAAARLYIHEGETDKAHYVLRRTRSTVSDPWLLAAEIAVASAANRTSKWMRNGQQMLTDTSLSAFEKNELASAVGMVELAHGKVRSARNLFRQALIRPTENSVAQVKWALRKRHMTGLDSDLEAVRLHTPRSFEAGAWEAFSESSWEQALHQSLEWLRDQPFSTRPVMLASYLALSVLEDYRYGEQILRIGLRANPNDVTLLNNMAFLCASLGKLAEAQAVFNSIETKNIRNLSQAITITATAGLIAFRRGAPDEGRSLYRHAIEMAKGQEFRKKHAIAAIYLAREEVLLGSSESIKAVEIANREAERFKDSDVDAILKNALGTPARTPANMLLLGP